MRSKTFKQVEHNKEAGRSHAGKCFPTCGAFPLERMKLFCVDCRSARGEVDISISHKDNLIMCLKFGFSLSLFISMRSSRIFGHNCPVQFTVAYFAGQKKRHYLQTASFIMAREGVYRRL